MNTKPGPSSACHAGVDKTDAESRLGEVGLGAEVGSVGAETAHGQTQGIECLTDGTQDNGGGDLREVGTKEEEDTIGEATHREGADDEDGDDEQEHGHHEFGESLDAVLHAAYDDEMDQQHEDDGIDDWFPRAADKVLEIGLVVVIA